MRHSLIVIAAVFASGLAAHADTIVTEQLSGTFASGSILGGSLQVDTTNGTVVGGAPTVTTGGVTDVFGTFVNQYASGVNTYVFNFADPAMNNLALEVAGSSFSSPSQICTVTNPCPDGTASAEEFAAGGFDSLTTTKTPVAATPEPASLALLGTGLLGAVGAFRKRSL